MATLKKDHKVVFKTNYNFMGRMLQGEHSAILLTFVKLLFVIKIFVLSIFEWPFYTGFTVASFLDNADLVKIAGSFL